MLNKDIEKNIRIMFPENAEDRTRRILQRLRDDKAKDEHVPGSLTWIGRCAVDHAAADLIEGLESQLPRWISVEERLPEKGKTVLVAFADGYMTIGTLWGDCWSIPYSEFEEPVAKGTWWMPLPEPPEEGKEWDLSVLMLLCM